MNTETFSYVFWKMIDNQNIFKHNPDVFVIRLPKAHLSQAKDRNNSKLTNFNLTYLSIMVRDLVYRIRLYHEIFLSSLQILRELYLVSELMVLQKSRIYIPDLHRHADVTEYGIEVSKPYFDI